MCVEVEAIRNEIVEYHRIGREEKGIVSNKSRGLAYHTINRENSRRGSSTTKISIKETLVW